MKEENLDLFYDTLYADKNKSEKIYSKLIEAIETEDFQPVLPSLLERCRNSDNKSSIQSSWSNWVTNQIDEVAGINPYLPTIESGVEIHSWDAIAWLDGTRNVDCRPKVYDGVSKSWKLLIVKN